MRGSMIAMWILFIIAQVLAFLFVCGIYAFDDKVSEVRGGQENKSQQLLYQSHARLSALGYAMVGASMCIYRLLPGAKTRAIKFVHSVLHFAALVIIAMGMVAIWRVKLQYDPNQDFFRVTHAYVGFPTLVCHVILFLCGFFSFYVFNEQCTRQCLAALHNFIGLCIFIFLTLSNFSGLCFREYSSESGKWDVKDMQHNATMLMYPLYAYSVLVIIMILCPQFEWELEGEI